MEKDPVGSPLISKPSRTLVPGLVGGLAWVLLTVLVARASAPLLDSQSCSGLGGFFGCLVGIIILGILVAGLLSALLTGYLLKLRRLSHPFGVAMLAMIPALFLQGYVFVLSFKIGEPLAIMIMPPVVQFISVPICLILANWFINRFQQSTFAKVTIAFLAFVGLWVFTGFLQPL